MHDIIEALNTALNTGNNPIPWTADAWVDVDMSKSYGVVTLEGQPSALWADDTQIAVIENVFIYLYSMGGNDATEKDSVTDVLKTLDVSFTMPSREYLHDINGIRYTWRAQVVR